MVPRPRILEKRDDVSRGERNSWSFLGIGADPVIHPRKIHRDRIDRNRRGRREPAKLSAPARTCARFDRFLSIYRILGQGFSPLFLPSFRPPVSLDIILCFLSSPLLSPVSLLVFVSLSFRFISPDGNLRARRHAQGLPRGTKRVEKYLKKKKERTNDSRIACYA